MTRTLLDHPADAALMVGMSAFDETQHPRGQAGNAGQFREKANDAPDSQLDVNREYAAGLAKWRILADRIPALEASIEKANRRLERAGVEERFTYSAEQRVWRDEHDRPWLVADVTLNRPQLSVGNWQFLAQHQKTPAGAIITHQIVGGDRINGDPSMRCDHCGQTRSRQKAFTVRDQESGETKQIGSSCLALFLGLRPEGLWSMEAEVGAELHFDEDDEFRLGTLTPNAYDGDELLLATIRQVDRDGGQFLSRGRATMYETATIDRVVDAYSQLTAAKATPAERDEMNAIREWVEALEPGAEDDYLQNLKAAFTRDDGYLAVYAKHAALAASAVSTYRRHLQREKERAAKEKLNSAKLAEFAFDVGETLKDKNLELTVLSMREGVDYGYGAPTHITLMDDDGHVFYWKATGAIGTGIELPDGAGRHFLPDAGSRVKITGGRVKDHRVSDFNGDHETVIWRVKIAPPQSQIDAWMREQAEEAVAG